MAGRSLAASRLFQNFAKIRSSGKLCGLEFLQSLASDALIVAREGGELQIHAFVLSVIFSELAESQTEVMVTEEEIKDMWATLGQPLIRYIDLVAGIEPLTESQIIANKALSAFFQARERKSIR